jgi:hypothetical protein
VRERPGGFWGDKEEREVIVESGWEKKRVGRRRGRGDRGDRKVVEDVTCMVGGGRGDEKRGAEGAQERADGRETLVGRREVEVTPPDEPGRGKTEKKRVKG